MPPTPANENFGNTSPSFRRTSHLNFLKDGSINWEVERLEIELARAQDKITMLQLDQMEMRRLHDEAARTHSDTKLSDSKPPGGTSHLPVTATMQAGTAPPSGNAWPGYDDHPPEMGDMPPTAGFNRTRNIWASGKSGQVPNGGFAGNSAPGSNSNNYSWAGRGSNQEFMDSNMPFNASPGPDPYRGSGPVNPDYDMGMRAPNNRRGYRFEGRFGAPSFDQSSYRNYPQYGGQGQYNMAGLGQNMGTSSQYSSHQPSAIGTPLSPLATEFTSGGGTWKSEVSW